VAYSPAQAYPPQPGVPAHTVTYGVNPAWLAASADRERAVGVLRAGFAEGRLSQDELNERVARAYASRTYGDLWSLTCDLPAGPMPGPHFSPYGPGAAAQADDTSVSYWRPAAALIITALVIFTLAALVTAVITAHTGQNVVIQNPGFQHAVLTPVIQHISVPTVIQAVPAHGPGS
jgi:Domain of unknown function (DUF1707)